MKRQTDRIKNIILTVVLSAAVLAASFSVRTYSGMQKTIENLKVISPNKTAHIVRTIHHEYKNNRFLSLKDLSYALSGTNGHFDVTVSASEIAINRGMDHEASGSEGEGFDEETLNAGFETGSLKANDITIDGEPVKYYSFISKNAEGETDAYMNITDLEMILDLDMHYDAQKENLTISGDPFRIDIDTYINDGLYNEVKSALIGNASHKKIYSSYNEDLPVPCASTTKLMTYLCVRDALSDGTINWDDNVKISKKAEDLSMGADGTVPMKAGTNATIKDLIYGMMLPSSNECALALAEHIAGSEEEFVKIMNQKAYAIGMSENTVFYNCNGLPVFSEDTASVKKQNRMSARDMFVLVCTILDRYPDIREVTDTQKIKLASFDKEVKNTNPLIYNMPGAVGLKTGTTNASGACLVAAYDIEDKDDKTTVVAIEFGAEDSRLRAQISEIMTRYAIQCVEGKSRDDNTDGPGTLPKKAKELIRMILENI